MKKEFDVFQKDLEKERKSGEDKKLYEGVFQNHIQKTGTIRRYPDAEKCLTIFCTTMLLPVVIGVVIFPLQLIQISVKSAFPNNGILRLSDILEKWYFKLKKE